MLEKAFTLIELLIVVAIIGILAAIAVPNFLNAQTRAKVARTISDMKALIDASDMYALDNGGRYSQDDNCGAYPDPKEACTYHRMTTPISYISTIPNDHWIADVGDTVGDMAIVLRYYEYWGKHSGGKFREVKFSKYGMGYVMRSLGPDLQPQMSTDGLLHIYERTGRLSYNSSNGVKSKGDFIATNRGME